MSKQERHQMIRNLVETRNIETQEDLAKALQESGMQVTQATVSRDIKELMLVKVSDMRGGYRYAFPRERSHIMSSEQLPGTAQGVAFAIDSMKWIGVMGTVAGDDTIFVAIERPEIAEELMSYFRFRDAAEAEALSPKKGKR